MAHGAIHSDATYHAGKRLLDVAAAAIGLLLCTPLLIGSAAWIRWVDGGPVFFSQCRVGRHGRLFLIYKLRTMALHAEQPGDARYAEPNDARVIRGCQWMRKSHVDELPQLWNILRCDMSVVGPRPERPEMYELLGPAMPGFERRLAGLPGLTGLAQVKNGYTNDEQGARRKLALDLKYLKKPSLIGDLKLVFATVPRVWDDTAM